MSRIRDKTLRWRHNGRDSVSNHQPHVCLLNCLFRRRSKKTSKLPVTGLCAGNSPGPGEFPAQMASNAENFSIWWCHHEGLTQYMHAHWLMKTMIVIVIENTTWYCPQIHATGQNLTKQCQSPINSLNPGHLLWLRYFYFRLWLNPFRFIGRQIKIWHCGYWNKYQQTDNPVTMIRNTE